MSKRRFNIVKEGSNYFIDLVKPSGRNSDPIQSRVSKGDSHLQFSSPEEAEEWLNANYRKVNKEGLFIETPDQEIIKVLTYDI